MTHEEFVEGVEEEASRLDEEPWRSLPRLFLALTRVFLGVPRLVFRLPEVFFEAPRLYLRVSEPDSKPPSRRLRLVCPDVSGSDQTTRRS